MIPQIEPLIAERDADAVYKYMRSGGWLTEYKQTERFEGMLSEYLGVKHVICVTSGTVALYLALKVIRANEFVAVPDFTMIATYNTATWSETWNWTDSWLVDVEPDTFCMDLGMVPRGRGALIYVPINGRCGDMHQVQEFCAENRLTLIEDACQAFGSDWNGKKLGTFGDVGVFSFSPHKIITTGQGGAVVTDNDDIAARVRKLKDFARVAPGVDEFDGIGYNFKFTDLQATVGIEQLKTIDWRIKRKKEIFAGYVERLGAERLPATDLSQTVPWFVDILVDERDRFIEHMQDHGIGTRPFYPAVHDVFKTGGDFPVASDISRRGVWLPSSLKLTDSDLDKTCDAINSFTA